MSTAFISVRYCEEAVKPAKRSRQQASTREVVNQLVPSSIGRIAIRLVDGGMLSDYPTCLDGARGWSWTASPNNLSKWGMLVPKSTFANRSCLCVHGSTNGAAAPVSGYTFRVLYGFDAWGRLKVLNSYRIYSVRRSMQHDLFSMGLKHFKRAETGGWG